jgi:hypothetical protein
VAVDIQATPEDLSAAAGYCRKESGVSRGESLRLFYFGDHRPSSDHKREFVATEQSVAAAKAAQEKSIAALEAAAAESGIDLSAMIWERLPYMDTANPKNRSRRFACLPGVPRRAVWCEFGSTTSWLTIDCPALRAGSATRTAVPADDEAVESVRWANHPAQYHRNDIQRIAGNDELAAAEAFPGFDSCPNCAATLAAFAEYWGSKRRPLADTLTKYATAGEFMGAALTAVGQNTLVFYPRGRVLATDPKPTVHGLCPKHPFAKDMTAAVKNHGAPVSAVQDAISHAHRAGGHSHRAGGHPHRAGGHPHRAGGYSQRRR